MTAKSDGRDPPAILETFVDAGRRAQAAANAALDQWRAELLAGCEPSTADTFAEILEEIADALERRDPEVNPGFVRELACIFRRGGTGHHG